jgi:hypothetical protein
MHEIRNTKFETNSKHECKNEQNSKQPLFLSFGILAFVLFDRAPPRRWSASCFGFAGASQFIG